MYTRRHYQQRGCWNAIVNLFWRIVALVLTAIALFWIVRLCSGWFQEMNNTISQ